MLPVYIDFESFWSTDHTLSKMSPTEYVMHPDTEIISVAIKAEGCPTDVIFGESEIKRHLDALDWSTKMAVGHNMSGFDALIMAWRFGIKPAMWGCTAAMARSKYGKTCGVSLKALAKELGVGLKLDLEATNTKGKHLKDFTPDELRSMEQYNKVDTELCAKLFKALARGFPKPEMVQIDMTTRMLVEPKFQLDYDPCAAHSKTSKPRSRSHCWTSPASSESWTTWPTLWSTASASKSRSAPSWPVRRSSRLC